MSPKPRFLPLLLFLFCVSALLIHNLHPFSSNSLSTSHSTQSTYSTHLTSPQPPNFTFTIKLLAFDRLHSISRCLHSLAAADYSTDKVNLHVYIDHFPQPTSKNESGFLIPDRKIEESRRILDFVDGFEWRFGDKFVHYRTGNVGLQAQWLEAWWPSSDDEFAFVVEDDLVASPLFYKFLRGLIVNYYYNASNFDPSIYGASLQRPRFVPGKHGNKLQLDDGTRLFLYQLVGTWGQLLFPKPWKEFRLWYDAHKAKGIKPILQGMVTTGWYNKLGEKIWTPWFIKFIHSRGYFNIYTNFLHERALSTSYRDAGVNYGKTAGPDSQLLDESSLDFNLLEMQPLSNLKWYDFCFREVLPGRIVKTIDELGSVLHSVQKQRSVIIVSLFKVSQAVTMNIVCQFERLNIRNYIFIGPELDFLHELARRGHPVIDTQKMLQSIRDPKLKDLQGSKPELLKTIIVKAYVIGKFIESGYSSWVIDGNMLPVSADVFAQVNGLSDDISATRNSRLLFVRSSPYTAKIWVDKFIYKIAQLARSTGDQSHFGDVVSKALKENGIKMRMVDELISGLHIDTDDGNETAGGGVGKKVVFWSSEMSLDVIKKRLEDLGMWVTDGDNSCTAVVCQPS